VIDLTDNCKECGGLFTIGDWGQVYLDGWIQRLKEWDKRIAVERGEPMCRLCHYPAHPDYLPFCRPCAIIRRDVLADIEKYGKDEEQSDIHRQERGQVGSNGTDHDERLGSY